MPENTSQCENKVYRRYENFFRQALFHETLNDDFIFEPWITVGAVYAYTGWGIRGEKHFSDEPKGSWKIDYPIKSLGDIEKLQKPRHDINERATADIVDLLENAIGDIVVINVDRSPLYREWNGDLSTNLGQLRGIENFMYDMMDNPEWLHRLLSFLRDGVLCTHEQAEVAGDWGLSSHQNQAMTYADELPDPAANVHGALRKQLWGYMAAQEYTLVSPEMFDQFLLQYQIPILSQFGLTAYGCCEDLTRKIPQLRKIPNLRRIAVSPFANVASCAEQIGTDYVISYRPSPADMVSYGLESSVIRSILSRDLASLQGCLFDITLKDVETVQGDPNRVHNWVSIVRNLVEA
jgi:hypothetical protein